MMSIKVAKVGKIRENIEVNELIKISVLNNCDEDPKVLAQILADRTGSEVVQVIGKKIVLYKKAKKSKIDIDGVK